MRRRIALGAALLLALALAFAAGMRVGGGGTAKRSGDRAPQDATSRAMYSPQVFGDPWFLERQRENVAALERECEESGKLCPEARAARRWLDEQGAD